MFFTADFAAAQQGSIASVYGEALQHQTANGLGGLVNCDGINVKCNFCTLGEMTNNLINWLFGFLIVLAVLVFAFAGFRLVTSGGSTEAVTYAKQRFTYVVIGLLLMLAAWLIVDTVLKGLTGSGMNFWGKFDVENCGFERDPQEQPYDEIDIDHSYENSIVPEYGTGPDDGLRGSGSIQLSGQLVMYAGYQFDSAIVSRVSNLANTYNLRVTSGYRSAERNRAVNGSATSHHLTGRAADFVGTADQMRAAAAAARAQGAIEVLIHDAGSGTHLHVAW